MRPRQACLGIRVQADAGVVKSAGRFNEAEASLPRNTFNGKYKFYCVEHSFNEAEASLPRNTMMVMVFRP